MEFQGNELNLPNFEGVSYDNGEPLVFNKINIKASSKVKSVSFETTKCLNANPVLKDGIFGKWRYPNGYKSNSC